MRIDSVRPDRERRVANRLSVYVPEPDRPINNGDILGDLAWRRNHKPPKIKKQVIEALVPFLKENNLTPENIISIGYDKYCGCSMCPCSPGYVVKLNRNIGSFDIWMEGDNK